MALATPLSPLAPETEVGLLAAQRVRSCEIAQTCGLSVRTVENHLANVHRKLGVTGRDELTDALGLTPHTLAQHQ